MTQSIKEAPQTYFDYYSKCGRCGRDRRKLAGALRARSQVEKKAAIKLILECSTCASALYKTFREETGYCETCRASLGTHKKCYLCGILLGCGHESEGSQVDLNDPDKRWCGSCCKLRVRAVVPQEEEEE